MEICQIDFKMKKKKENYEYKLKYCKICNRETLQAKHTSLNKWICPHQIGEEKPKIFKI